MFDSLFNLAQRRAKIVLVLAVAFLAIAGLLGGSVANRLVAGGSPVEDPGSQSKIARDKLTAATGADPDASVLALIRTGQPVDSPVTRTKVKKVAETIASDPAVAKVDTFYSTGRRSMVSLDGRATYVLGFFKHLSARGQVDAAKRVSDKLDNEPNVLLGGVDIGSKQINDQVQSDLALAEAVSFPLLFILALFVFRGVVAALLPIGAGVFAILGSFLGLRIVNEITPLSIYALNLVIAIGLGLAIDYSLFMVSRYREELERVGPGPDALRHTLNTAGRTIAFSALTVAAALASLLIFPEPFLYSMGAGGIFVALFSASVALIVLPAVLALLGPRVNSLAPARWKRAAQRTARGEEEGFWYRLAHADMRHPGTIAVASAAFLIVLGIPFFGIKFTGVDPTILPKSASAHEAFTLVNTTFPPNRASPAYIAVQAPSSAGPDLQAYAQRLRGLPGAAAVQGPRPIGGGYWRIDVVSKTTYLAGQSQTLVRDIRAIHNGFPTYVGGDSASFVDTQDSLKSLLPYALATLAATTLVILFLMTGSVILPFKTLLMNILTVSAVFGLLVLIFQDGRLESVLRYTSQGALNSTQPLLIGAVVFALSTDYGVFLLTRIKEGRDQGLPNEEAVAHGLERTGRIVTAAALLFCVAVGAFASSKIVFIKEIGVGLALGVIIDATFVRGLLVPSLMKLLGRWNWWAPEPLRRLHERFGLREAVVDQEGAKPEAAPAPTVVGAPAGRPAVVVADGPLAGVRYELDGEVAVGREDADLTVDDPEVSRRHAVLRAAEGALEVADLGSANGTFVNGERISEPRRLADGDVVRVGQTSLGVEVPVPVAARTVVSPLAARAVLVVARGASAGKRFPVEEELSLGREGADLTLDDPEVSRRHAVVRAVDGALEVADLGSANGTYVNGQRIGEPRRLVDGDVIRVGQTLLNVELANRSADLRETVIAPGAKNEVSRGP